MTVVQVFLDTTDKGLWKAEGCWKGGEGCQPIALYAEVYILETEGDTQRVDLYHHLNC